MKKIFFLLFLCIFANSIYAAEDKEPPVQDVYVGIYVNQVYALSLKENQFSTDFYIWFRWKGSDIKPIDTFEVVNGRTDSKETIYSSQVEGYNYAVARVTATITKFWEISHFPLDNHNLTIEVEDSQNEDFRVRFVADTENSSFSPDIQVPGWKVGKSSADVKSHGYKTNYGDISLPSNNESAYSRYIFSLSIERPGYGYFLKLFLSVFIATLISFLSFLIKPTDLDPRFGLGIGAIFAAVASQYVIGSSLPDTNLLTLADKLNILSIVYIFLSILESTVSLTLYTRGKEVASRKLDILSLIVLVGTYLLINLWIVL